MGNLSSVLLTLAVGTIFGLLFMRLKVPNGLRIGALVGAALLNIFFGAARMPDFTKYIVQIVAGAITGCTMERSYIKRLPMVMKPTAITVGTFLVLNLSVSALVRITSDLDWPTALMGAVPGGVTDIPIIAEDMGADTPKVALLQLARYMLGIAVFPPMVLVFDNFMLKHETEKSGRAPFSPAGVTKREKSRASLWPALVCTCVVSTAGGFIGYLTGVPAGVFLVSTVFVLVLKLKFDFAYLSSWLKRTVQVVSGCFIGSLMTMNDMKNFRLLVLPVVIVLGGYILNCFITGRILSKTCGFTRKEGMLTTIPAGAQDLALSSSDLGLENMDVIIVQLFRAMIAMAAFPQIINVLLLILPE